MTLTGEQAVAVAEAGYIKSVQKQSTAAVVSRQLFGGNPDHPNSRCRIVHDSSTSHWITTFNYKTTRGPSPLENP